MKTQFTLYVSNESLQRIIRQLNQSINNAPPGYLHIMRKKNAVQYYHCDNENHTGTYIRKNELELARKLAQKSYEQDCLKAALEIRDLIEPKSRNVKEPTLEKVSLERINRIYNSLRPERKALVDPVILPDDEYLKMWRTDLKSGASYQRPAEYTTWNGNQVRSKSEILIDNLLKQLDLPYKYEQPLMLIDGRTVYPDFTILDMRTRQEVYFEHFGWMDKEDYREKTFRKINCYARSGYIMGDRFLCTFETASCPLDMSALDALLQKRFRN